MANGFARLQQLVSNIALENIREQQRLRDPLTQLRLAQARKALEQGDIELGFEIEEAQFKREEAKRKRALFPFQQEKLQAEIEASEALTEQRGRFQTPEEKLKTFEEQEKIKQAGRETLAELTASLRTATEKKDQKSKTLGNLTSNQMLLEKQRISPKKTFDIKGKATIEFENPTEEKRHADITHLETAKRLGLTDLDLDKANLVDQDVLDYFDFNDRMKAIGKLKFTDQQFILKDKDIVKLIKSGITLNQLRDAVDVAVKRTNRTRQEAIKHLLSRL